MRNPEPVRRLVRWVLLLALFVWLAVAIGLVRFWILGAILIAFLAYTTSAVDGKPMKERFRPAGPTADRGLLLAIRLSVDFFFQAEDGIRDLTVTGVQTCALPI